MSNSEKEGACYPATTNGVNGGEGPGTLNFTNLRPHKIIILDSDGIPLNDGHAQLYAGQNIDGLSAVELL